VFVSQLVRDLLEAGLCRRDVAKTLGVSLSTVSRHARRLGAPSPRARSTRYDWDAIRRFYEAGATVRDCQARFGFSNGAWDCAVSRGDVTPRRDSRPQVAHGRREAVARLLARGASMGAVAAELGIAPATVAYHARCLGIPPVESSRRRYDWEAVQRAHDAGNSVRECQDMFGFSRASWHAAVRRGALVPRPRAMSIEALVAGSRSRRNLKRRLVAAGLKHEWCERCGLTEWRGQPLSLALHHINGDGAENRLENLELLCPNCHSQTPNFSGRNRGRHMGVVAD
jgi:predicted transcriptional regulator